MKPHNFSKLIETKRSPSVFAGAGLSWGLVPGPAQLLEEHREEAEKQLGIASGIGPGDESSLYLWADKILDQMSEDQGSAKLALACSLGIVDNPVWAARVSYPASGLSARHRVMARLARENVLQGIWTWNWDCLLESALEAIGFERGAANRDQPWLTRYNSVVIQEDFGRLGDRDLLCILKPHGCASKLAEAVDLARAGDNDAADEISNRFMIGSKELTEKRENPTDELFFTRMRADLQSYPSMVVGWSVSEPYLQAVIDEALSLVLKKGQAEELSIVDVSFNDKGHTVVANCYGLTKDDVFFELDGAPPGFTTDEFFLWLQRILAISRISDAIPNGTDRTAFLDAVDAFEDEILNSWTDSFLPAWTRLCWRGGLVMCAGFQRHQLAMERAEEHIPLTLPGLIRPDLASAGNLLRAIPDKTKYDFDSFPGGLWDASDLRLILPLPCWGELDELESLKPLTAGYEMSYVEKLDVVPIHFDPGAPSNSEELVAVLKTKLSRVLDHPAFADVNAIGTANGFGGGLA